MARPVYYRGVPVGNLSAANQVTVPGSLVDVRNYRHRIAQGRGAAIASMATGIARDVMPRSLNPYAASLGDGDDIMAPGSSNPTPSRNSSSGWMNVVNTFVGNLSKGLAAKIGGYNPMAPIPQPVSSIPSWAPLALAGVGGFLLLKHLRKRA